MGRHIWTVDPETMKTHMIVRAIDPSSPLPPPSANNPQATYVNTILYQISLCFSKVSILLLYLRILAYSYARRAALAILVVVLIYNLFGLISTSTVCTPVKSFWDPEVEGHCHPGSFMWAVIGFHIGTDFLIFLLPMPVVYRMTLPPGQKLGVMLAFGLGFMYASIPSFYLLFANANIGAFSVCLISILRAIRIHELYETTDITWDYVEVANWSAVELNISILVPCLIVLKPLLAKLFPSLSTPQQSTNPRDAPPTIGSDPTGFGRADAGVQRDAERSEKSSVSDYEHPREETRHLEHSSL